MGDRLFGMLDMAIVGVPVIGFCIWQLVSINRTIARDKRDSPQRPRHPVGEHPEDER